MIRFISVFIILFLSCGSSTTNESDKNLIDTIQRKQSEDDANFQVDTLRDPSHYFYLSNLPLRQVGQLILTDSIQPSDNKITFECMDSISSENVNTREYYYPVFLKILDKADGALAEAVGEPAMTYVEKYPKEFAERSKALNEDQFKRWASNTGYELYFTYETENKAKRWTNAVVKSCSNCDTTQLKRLEEFNRLAIAAMKEVADI